MEVGQFRGDKLHLQKSQIRFAREGGHVADQVEARPRDSLVQARLHREAELGAAIESANGACPAHGA